MPQLVVVGVATGDQQVVAHGGGEQVGVLGEEHPGRLHEQCGLAAPAGSDHRYPIARLQLQGRDGRAAGGIVGFGEREQAARSDAGPGQRDSGTR